MVVGEPCLIESYEERALQVILAITVDVSQASTLCNSRPIEPGLRTLSISDDTGQS
jgi:hypothetical protein